MKVFLDETQKAHDPESMIFRGQKRAFPECAARVDILKEGVAAAGLSLSQSQEFGRAPLGAIHSLDYLDFLENGYALWAAQDNASPEIIPNTHPGRRMNRRPSHIVGLAGYYMADQACAIGPDTWRAIYASAQTALSACEAVIEGDDAAYGLSRPPGHHAFADMAGGFCYINNVAVAAQHALDQGAARVAILDVDVHHGNGTQGIFYHRKDVLFTSIHGDPEVYYPFYAGYADERGEGAGEGFNYNLPLPPGSDDEAYMEALPVALKRIADYGPDMLLLSLGLDIQAEDPVGVFRISAEGFSRIGAAIAGLGLPTTIIQEGGYICEGMAENLSGFLKGYTGA